MFGACLGIAGNQSVAWYKRVVGRRIHSATLLADARHSWLDAVSSGGALVGLVAVALGFPLGDPIAGFAITAFIAHVGYEVTRDVLHHLMDGVEPEHIDEARQAAEAAGHVEVPVVRGRWTGRALHFELQPELPAGMTLAEAQTVAERMETAVLGAIEPGHHGHGGAPAVAEPEPRLPHDRHSGGVLARLDVVPATQTGAVSGARASTTTGGSRVTHITAP